MIKVTFSITVPYISNNYLEKEVTEFALEKLVDAINNYENELDCAEDFLIVNDYDDEDWYVTEIEGDDEYYMINMDVKMILSSDFIVHDYVYKK